MNISLRPLIELRRLALLTLMAGLAFASPSLPAASPPATWTTGHKKVLIIPVRFTDQTGPSDTPNASGYISGWGNITNGTTTAAINAFFQRASYGRLSMEFTVLPEINLGVSYTVYNATFGTTGISKFAAWDEPGSFADDVRAKARQVGQALGQAALYDSDNYDLDFLFCGFIPGQGTLASGRAHGKGIFGTTSLALAHEFGHNFGLQHANGISRSTYYAPIKGGTFFTDTYGDVYDLMGWKNTTPVPLVPDRDLNPYWKWQMGWLPEANIATPAVSGTYRIHAFDQPTLEAGKNYALRIVRDPSRVYWFSYRQSITNAAEAVWSNNGLEVRIGGESVPATGGHTTLLDMTPGSRGLANIPSVTNNPYATLYDAPLAIGRTYSDHEANLHVTPVKKGGTVPESLDVVLNYGPFPGNAAPTVSLSPATVTIAAGVAQTFTATASDPNSDALSYYWEFDDPDALGGTAAGNTNPDARLSTQGSHTWTRSGTFLVRCTVTDMKGGKTIASATVTITGGTTALRTISGVVKDENGNPLAGAVVNNYKGGNPNLVRYGATNFVGASETAADGKYVVHVPAGITGTFYLNVLHQGFPFTCFTAGGAVGVYSANVANVDFTRVRTNRTISGGVYVAGRGYNPATDGTLTVTVNGQNLTATGGGWTTSVADGTPLNITAASGTPANAVFGTFPNPYVAVDDFNLLHFFLNVPGLMPQVGFTSATATSDDTVGTVNIPVTLALPPGSNSWPANQFIYYWLDPSGTAEYGVDYKMAGGSISFTGGQVPAPYLIPLKILPTGEPKSKTVVIKLGPASSIVNMGPITTFTYTITNAPTPPPNAGVIQFAQAAYSVAEAAGTVTLVATRTGSSTGSASGYYRTADGTALAGQDYAPSTNVVTWADGDSANKNVAITILNDAVIESNETFTVSFFTNTVGASLGALTTATVTITDDDTPPPSPGVIQFAQSNYFVGEAAGTVTLVATRTGGSSSNVNGYYRTANGTATAGQDYTATTNFVTWANGDTAPKNVVITILNDGLAEADETFTVTFFTTFGGATIGVPATATVTITDDDTPPPSPGVIQFAQTNYSVGEAAGTVTLVATRTGGSSSNVNGYYRTANGTATAGQDYTATTNFVTWANGDTAPKNVVIPILNDGAAEADETFTVTFFTTFGGATIGAPAMATVTITDDDTPPPSPGVIQFAQSNYFVGEAAGTVTLVATRTGGSSSNVNGYYRTANGTATTGQDYTATTNFVTWANGDAAPKNVVITILNDGLAEADETFTVTFFTTFGGATIGAPAIATVTIADDDTPPPSPGVIQFAQTNYTVGEAAGTVTLVATRTGGSSSNVNGYYRTANGTATAGQDYAATTNFVTWANGDTAPKNVVITILNDGTAEADETFTVSFFTTFGGATIGVPAVATVTITDDDTPPPSPGVIQFAQSNYFVGEAAGTVTLVATRTGGSSSNVNGYYRTANGTATAGQDYTATTNFVTWANGDTAPKNVVITILNDGAAEADESFTVTFFTTFGGATLGGQATTTVTINDDDTPPPSAGVVEFAQSTYNFAEAAGTATLVATRTDGANGMISVYYRTTDGTATGGQDYTPTTNAMTWPDGDTAPKNIVITILNDSLVETNETFYVSLFAPSGGATLGTRVSAVVTILDDDVVSAPENHAPVLPGAAVLTVPKLAELVYTNTATDSDVPTQTLTYQLILSPSGATIDANGIVRWTPPTTGTNYFLAKVTDNGSPALSATNSFYVIVREPVVLENHVPLLPRPTVVNVVKLTEMVFTNTAMDIDVPAQTLTYELLAMPAGATIDATGIIRWTPSLAQGSSTNRFRTKVTDSGSPPKSATNVFYAIVTEGNSAPILFGRSLVALTNGAVLSEPYTAADSDTPANTLGFGLVSGPGWLAFTQTGEKTAQLTGTPPMVTTETHLTAVLQVTDNGTPPLTNRLTVNLTLLPPPIVPSFVTRRLPAGYVPGTTLTVTLQANPPGGTATYAVTDTPPTNWTVGAISHAGQIDPVTGQVKFGFFNDATSRTLTYQVTPPLAETGPMTFMGSTSKDTVVSDIHGDAVLNQMRSHPADSSPTDLQITTGELAAYATAWQNGSPWPTAPNPIEVSFVTRAGFLVQRGGTYTVNPLAPLPLAWNPNPPVSMLPRITTDTGILPTGKGCWRFLPPKLAVGTPATVTIIVNPGSTNAVHAVEEIPPAGWAVANVSHAGVYDAASGRVRWGLFTDQTPRTLTYDIVPTGALAPFAGVVSFDGSNAPIAGAFEPMIVPAIAEPEFAPVTRLPSGEMVLPLSTRFGTITVIEISDDLRLWTPVWTNSPGNQLFRDQPLNLPPGRYYRSVEQ